MGAGPPSCVAAAAPAGALTLAINSGNGRPQRVVLAVRPQEGDAGQMLGLVFFLEDMTAATAAPTREVEGEPGRQVEAEAEAGSDTHLMARLEAENRQLRERLQATTEEYESSHEELKAANEELQSINEEYRSTTEELETSKEELQSVNEELQTVNAELKNKLEEVSQTRDDLENLMAATEIATLFLDRELRIQRYTRITAELFNVMPGDRGRPIEHLTNRLQYEGLADDARQVLQTLVPVEREVQDTEGRWFLAQLRPYRTLDHRIDGVVLAFVEIGELKETEAALRQEKEYTEKIVDTVREGLLVLEPDLTVEFANGSFGEMFAVSGDETVGRLIYNLGNGQWDIPELRTLLEEVLPQDKVFNGYRVEHTFEDVGHRVMILNARRLDHVERILLAIEDVTEKEEYEAQLRALTATLEQRVARRTAQVEALARQLTVAEHEERGRIAQVLHDDLQQQLYALQMQLAFLREEAAPDVMQGAAHNADLARLLQEIAAMEAVVEGAVQTARRLSLDLSPPVLEGESLAKALVWLAQLMQERHRLQVEIEAEDYFIVPDVDRRVLLFQAVRELLFNVVKHAEVAEAVVRLQLVDDPQVGRAYRVDVIDKGSGFDVEAALGPTATANGRGLRPIRQRLFLSGGRMEVSSTPGGGTQVTILVAPQREESREAGDDAV